MKSSIPGLCVLSALLTGCSPDSSAPSGPDPTGGQLEDPASSPEPVVEQTTSLDAGNFDTLLIASLDSLRSDYYTRASVLLNLAAQAWEPHYDAVVGTTVHDCRGGGTVNRDVVEAPVTINFLPRYNLVSELIFSDCVIDGQTLNGVVGWNWNQSSPAQLGGTTYYNEYSFTDFSLAQAESAETITGTLSENIDIAGPGDGYTRSHETQHYERVDAQGAVQVTDGSYTQRFDHYIAQSAPANGVFHLFKEQGFATVSIGSLGLYNATVSIDPEFIYANEETETSTMHSTSLASGATALVMADGSRLAVTVSTPGSDSVTYTLTDLAGQQTTIEREWIAPAACQPDERFNYESC